MEFFNSRQCMGLIPTISTALCLLLSSCNSMDEQPIEATQNLNETEKVANDMLLHLSNGDVLMLSDTTTYVVDDTEFDAMDTASIKTSASLFESVTRAGGVLRAYGFDSQEPETDWKKYMVKNWEQYGVSSGIYIARYVKVHKDLQIEKGSHAVPGDYTSDKAPKDAMGWEGSNKVIGFTATNKTDYISDGVTRIFIINCDLSGKVYNKNIPANPENFEWAYKVEIKPDVWD